MQTLLVDGEYLISLGGHNLCINTHCSGHLQSQSYDGTLIFKSTNALIADFHRGLDAKWHHLISPALCFHFHTLFLKEQEENL